MKNPNGYGSVHRLSGRRRKPFGARITVGWTDEGKQIYRYIGYFATRPEALVALADYHKNPYSIEAATVTFAELWEKWSAEKFPRVSRSNINGYTAAYKAASALHDIRFVDLRKTHMQGVVDRCDRSWATKKKIKVLFNQLYRFAAENDIITKDYARFVDIGKKESGTDRKPFAKKEIDLLWRHVDRMDYIDTVLIQIYTGLRIGELLAVLTADVDPGNRIMRGGIKTGAGKNRIIPINRKILPFIARRAEEGHKYLIVNRRGRKMSYENYYRDKWQKMMEQLGLDHKPHNCRHTFATLMDNAGANKLSIKRIMGHASADITDKVYTHKDIEELKKAVDLI